MEAYGLSDIGKYREENQDRYLIDGALGLYAVADGMGGLPGGAAAASKALHILAERMVGFFVDPRDRSRSFVYDYIKKTLQTLNAEVASEMGGAGTTLVILLTVGERAFFANAGDSPGFLYRDGRLTKMTRDHNVAGMEEGVPQISDLGIGRILRTNEMASTTTGTIYYMAPEVLHTDYEGAHATFNADIWSVGVTLYEMLYGVYPFGIDLRMPIGDIVRVIVDRERVLDFPKQAAAKLKNVLKKALERCPRERYANVDEMLGDLTKLTKAEDEEIDKAISEIQLLYEAGEIETAEAGFKELLGKYPDNARVYLNLGEFYNKCGSYVKAVDTFKKGLEIDPERAILHWGLAMAYQKKKNNALALKSLRKALDCGLEAGLERYAKILIGTLSHQKGKGGEGDGR